MYCLLGWNVRTVGPRGQLDDKLTFIKTILKEDYNEILYRMRHRDKV